MNSGSRGVELCDANEECIGFSPSANLREIMNEKGYTPKRHEPSISEPLESTGGPPAPQRLLRMGP